VKFHQEKCTYWEKYCHLKIKIKRFGVFIPRLVTLVDFSIPIAQNCKQIFLERFTYNQMELLEFPNPPNKGK
jgi:hypothetical protein